MTAARFVLRRVAHGALLLFAISLASFALIDLAPGDFLDEMRLNPRVSAETVDAMRSQLGLDRPLPVKYARWLASAARGEFGISLAYGAPVSSLIAARAGNTLLLTAAAMLLAWAIAVPAGLAAAVRSGRWQDRAADAASSALLAAPDILLATGFLLLALRTGLFPVGGPGSVGGARDLAWHAALPTAALVWGALPWLYRHVRTSAAEALAAPYVRAAFAAGIPKRRVLFRYVLPAASNPLISLFGLSVAGLLSSSLVIEAIMGWPGLGPLFLDAISARDGYVVIGTVLASSLFLVGGNLIADVLLYVSDPRVRRPEARA